MTANPFRRRRSGDGEGSGTFAASTRALRVRNFRVFFIGELISSVGSWSQMVAQNWFVLELTGSGEALGITVALQMLPILLFSAWAGALVDRVDNRRVIAIASCVGAAQAIALGLLTATGHISVGWVYCFAFVLGTATAFERPAAQAMNYSFVGPDDLPSAVGLTGTVMASGRLVGPAIAGVLMALVGIEPVFFLNAATFAAVLVAVVMIRPAELFPRKPSKVRARARDGLAYAWREPTLRLGLGVMFVVGTFAYNFAIIFPSMVRFEFDASSAALGVLLSVSALGSLTGGLAIASLYRPTVRTMAIITLTFAVCITAASLAPGLIVFVVLSVPMAANSAMFTAVVQSVLQQASAPEFQGRVMSIFQIAWIGTSPIGGLVAGVVIDAASPRVAMGIGAVSALLSGVVALAVARRWAHRDAHLAAEIAAVGDIQASPAVPGSS